MAQPLCPTLARGALAVRVRCGALAVVAGLVLAAAALPGPAGAQDSPNEPAGPSDPPPQRVLRLPPPAGQAESLPALLARVLPDDPQVRVAQALLQATEERRLQARSRLGPVVGVSTNYGQSEDIEFGVPIDRVVDRAEATLRWNLLNYGNDQAELKGATRDIVAASAEVRRAREEATERIAGAYAELLRAESLLPRAVDRLAAVRRLVQQVQRQNEAGKASEADMQQAQASLLDAEIAQEQLASEVDSARQRLATLVGGEVRPVTPVALPPPTAVEAPRPAVVAAAQERAVAARERVRPLPSLRVPRIDLEMRHALSDRTTPQNTTETQNAWLVTARWDFPVGGEAQARRAEGERRAEAVQAEADRVLNGVQAELLSLGPRIAQGKRAVAQLANQVERYDMLVRAGELQFEAGRRTLAQLVQLHESRFNAEQRLADQASRLLVARMRQLALTGELLPALEQPAD
jgi:outer membrane protein TolC